MIDLRSARLLARYRMWADQLTFDAVAALPPGEAAKERPTHFKTMIGTLNHIYLVDLIWQAHLEGRDHGFKSRELMLHEGLPELRMAQQEASNFGNALLIYVVAMGVIGGASPGNWNASRWSGDARVTCVPRSRLSSGMRRCGRAAKHAD